MKTLSLPDRSQTLPGRSQPMPRPERHFVSGRAYETPWPERFEQALFGLGCFWGAERLFWRLEGVYLTAVGYAGGYTPNPRYEEVCSGLTGHAEVVWMLYDPEKVDYERLLRVFWESHDPTQGMRQGNDWGTQYRSVIFTFTKEQHQLAWVTRRAYQDALSGAGLGMITTEIAPAPPFYFAETYHQQYLAKNPHGYCGIGGVGVSCPQLPASQTVD